MLLVYTYRTDVPKNCIDFSALPLAELVDAALAVFSHQKEARIWFGYLDGWMLTPQEDVLLRKVIRKFECGLVTHFPMALSQSWKNEIDTIYTSEVNGDSQADNNGSSVLNGSSVGHDVPRTESSTDRRDHQNRKARRPEARRVKKGQGSASEPSQGV